MNFDEAIKKYETHRPGKSYFRTDKNPCETTIRGDTDRSFLFLPNTTNKEKWCKNLYKNICNELFINSTIDYYQGMSEIGSYIIYYYFKESVENKFEIISKELVGSSKLVNEEEEIETLPSKKDSLVDEKLSDCIDSIIYENCMTTICNVMDDKFLPVVQNNFEMYDKINLVFLRMMKKRNIKIDILLSKKYMNTTLSWFTRSVSELKDLYKVLALILNSPCNVTFLLLVKYFNEIENGEKIRNIPENLQEEIIKLEQEYVKTQEEMEQPCISARKVLFGLSVGGVVLAIFLYQTLKKDK
ncbi:Rab-GAP TBC domain protein [Tubulinosema ratisbonensis]|uniref:Rab-GAP TBC domain protein n=1 Tax=Tubulinosema ratisbonensis TaxID=291195 RepID=A0A437AQB1_9MICR|nr:Rab-GAP TBC domain protein [Tubulinosema ratisbonensis]